MNSTTSKIKNVSFIEHPVVDFMQSEPCIFDITTIGLNYPSSFIVNNIFSGNAYCKALLHKIIELDKTDITKFLDYQCTLIKNPSRWFDQLDALVEQNFDYLEENGLKRKARQFYMDMQIYRINFKNKNTGEMGKDHPINWNAVLALEKSVKFDFSMVKSDLEKIDSYSGKKAYLIELKADFLESKKICSTATNKSFGTLIDIELKKIEKLQSLFELPSQPANQPPTKTSKLHIRGNTNILVDIFYRLLYEFSPGGKPFLDGTPTEVANMIVNNFTNSDGKDLSINSVLTMLAPGKPEKRPSCDKRFCMHHLIQTTTFIISNLYMIDYLDIVNVFPFIN